MRPWIPPDRLEPIGRDAERSWIWQLITEAATGHGGAIVVTGPRGIGKSALLSDAAGRVASGEADGNDDGIAGVRVASASGTTAEQAWPYAGLHLVLSALAGTDAFGADAADEIAAHLPG